MTTPRTDEVRTRALALELTKGCNLRCGYCYYGTREAAYDASTSMSPETAQRAVDRLFDDARDEEVPHLHLFGGEPLLNFPLVESVVGYARARGITLGRRMTFELTTNGTLLTPKIIDWLNANAIAVGVSIDGPPTIQDATRPAADGGGSSRFAEPKIRDLLQSRAGTSLAERTHASVVLSRRFPDIEPIVAYLKTLGFRKVVVSPATDDGADGFGDADLPRLLDAYTAAAAGWYEERTKGNPGTFAHFEDLARRALSGRKKTSPCGGGRDYLGVSADGSVYLCYRFFEDDAFKMGSLEGGISTAVTQRLDATAVDARTDCRSCWARYYCGGNCHHDNLKSTGDAATPNPVHCDVFRHTMGLTLEMLTRLGRIGHASEGPGPTSMNDPSPVDGAWSPKAVADLHRRPIVDELLVYSPASHAVVNLNPTAARVLALCDGTTTVDALIARLASEFSAPEDVIRSDVEELLRNLRGKGVVT